MLTESLGGVGVGRCGKWGLLSLGNGEPRESVEKHWEQGLASKRCLANRG